MKGNWGLRANLGVFAYGGEVPRVERLGVVAARAQDGVQALHDTCACVKGGRGRGRGKRLCGMSLIIGFRVRFGLVASPLLLLYLTTQQNSPETCTPHPPPPQQLHPTPPTRTKSTPCPATRPAVGTTHHPSIFGDLTLRIVYHSEYDRWNHRLTAAAHYQPTKPVSLVCGSSLFLYFADAESSPPFLTGLG